MVTGMGSPWCKWLSAKCGRKIQQQERKVSADSGNMKVINDLRDSMCMAEGKQTDARGLRTAHRKEAARKSNTLGLSFGKPATWFCFVDAGDLLFCEHQL